MFNIVEDIKSNKTRREQGRMNCIPLYDVFPRLSKFIPGLMKSTMYGITASSGVGKSKFARFAFMKTPIEFVQLHPESGINVRILYFALEESYEDFMYNIISMRLAEKHKIFVGTDYLQSYMEDPVSDNILKYIEQDAPWREQFFEYVDVFDNIMNPTGIYKECRKVAGQLGVFKDREVDVKIFHEDGTSTIEKQIRGTQYIPNDPNMYVIVVVDHINLLKREKAWGVENQNSPKMSKHETIEKWVTEYARAVMCKEWGWSVVNIMQQNAESEKQVYNRNTGTIIADKVKPTLENLGNNKEIQRDHHVIMGMWNPSRYRISQCGHWNIEKLGACYRELIILKNRRNADDMSLDLFFEGASGIFKELPRARGLDKNERDKIYKKVQSFHDRKLR